MGGIIKDELDAMGIDQITSLDDPRIAAYLNLKERELARQGGRFIAEGELVVRRLIDSRYQVESVLVAQRRLEEIAAVVPTGVPVYVATAEMVNRIVGYRFHSGVMAVGLRGWSQSIEELAGGWGDGKVDLVICPEMASADNMGSMIRLTAGFAGGIVLGERCCDPFFRQSVRVSMGTIFRVPMVRSDDILRDMGRLRSEFGVELVASVSEDGEPLASAKRNRRMGYLFGNEAQGLAREHIDACDRRVTIPMGLGTDSLNVSVAAGIVLYHFTQYAAEA